MPQASELIGLGMPAELAAEVTDGTFTGNQAFTGNLTVTGSVGIGTTTNLSTLTINGGIAPKGAPAAINAATYTVGATDSSLRFTTTACAVTLPSAASFPGRMLFMCVLTAHAITSASSNVLPANSETPGTAILAATAGKTCILQSNGTNWVVVVAN